MTESNATDNKYNCNKGLVECVGVQEVDRDDVGHQQGVNTDNGSWGPYGYLVAPPPERRTTPSKKERFASPKQLSRTRKGTNKTKRASLDLR